ncbi:hypothetical protein Tco_0511420 [Tanacetum coccineum]
MILALQLPWSPILLIQTLNFLSHTLSNRKLRDYQRSFLDSYRWGELFLLWGEVGVRKFGEWANLAPKGVICVCNISPCGVVRFGGWQDLASLGWFLTSSGLTFVDFGFDLTLAFPCFSIPLSVLSVFA